MAKMGKFSVSEMKKLQKQLNKLKQNNVEDFIDSCAKELAARLLAKVIKRTPVGDYSKEVEVIAKRDSKYHKKGDIYTKRVNPSGRNGGVLRRGWTSKTHEEAENGKGTPTNGKSYADSLEINHTGNTIVIEIKNPVEYASYVEYGHRKRNHSGWVQGHFMLTISEQEIQDIAPKVLEAKIKKFLGDCFQ